MNIGMFQGNILGFGGKELINTPESTKSCDSYIIVYKNKNQE